MNTFSPLSWIVYVFLLLIFSCGPSTEEKKKAEDNRVADSIH
jgi:hypothetical protein